VWQISVTTRTGPGQWLAEAIATFGLLLAILGCSARSPAAVPYAVGLYITSAYWFTASTSFANPAVTIARALSDTFAGIAPTGVVAFIAAQLAGMLGAVALGRWFWRDCKQSFRQQKQRPRLNSPAVKVSGRGQVRRNPMRMCALAAVCRHTHQGR
jgi:glycerol uptake facilitator-like aquaporin